jgi:excisionase family DNA binding protein
MQDYITTRELAELLKIRPNTIERWRTNRECPIPWINVRRRVLFARADVVAYLESQKRDRVSNTATK